MQITKNKVIRASLKRIVITVAFILSILVLIGIITLSYVVGNSLVQPKSKTLTFTPLTSALLYEDDVRYKKLL